MNTQTLDRLSGHDISFDCVCHIFPTGDAKRSFCGVPREEQPKHGPGMSDHQCKNEVYCPICGHERCATCRGAFQ